MALNQRRSIYDKQVTLTSTQIKLLDVITKQTLLQTLSFAGFGIFIILCVIMVVIDTVINNNYNMTLIVGTWCFMLSNNHAYYCVYLGFIVNKRLYMKSCKPCHGLLKSYCTKLVETRIIEMHNDIKQLKVLNSISKNEET